MSVVHGWFGGAADHCEFTVSLFNSRFVGIFFDPEDMVELLLKRERHWIKYSDEENWSKICMEVSGERRSV